MPLITMPELINEIGRRAAGKSRVLIAVAGPPASGKSTLAAELAARLGASAAVLPMDGFHLDNDQLEALGLLDRKGAPETFDAQGFVNLLHRLRCETVVSYPAFDREADRTVPDAGQIEEDTRIVIVEGNYLLLNVPPWASLCDLFDLTIRLDVSKEDLETRLVQRWLDHGMALDQARARALGNDMTNAEFVVNNSFAPDFIFKDQGCLTC